MAKRRIPPGSLAKTVKGQQIAKAIKEGKVGPVKILKTGRTQHAKLHHTPLRIYGKPSLAKDVIRKAGVERTSPVVLAINEAVSNAKPASNCKGKAAEGGYEAFRECLRREMKKALKDAGFYVEVERAKETLATATAA